MEAINLAEDDRLPLVEAGSGEADVNQTLEMALAAFIDVLDRHTLATMAGRAPESDGARDRTDGVRPPRDSREVRAASAGALG